MHSSIAPHLRNLDELCYENARQNHINQPLQINQTYPKNKCSVIIKQCQTHSGLAEYLHASCYGPVKSTFIQATNSGFFKHGQAFLNR